MVFTNKKDNTNISYKEFHVKNIEHDTCQLLEINHSIFIETQYQ